MILIADKNCRTRPGARHVQKGEPATQAAAEFDRRSRNP
jgi:hypothetical protein